MLFEPALTAALGAGRGAVVEVSPHPVLVPAIQDIVELTHGIYRARTGADRERRKAFSDELCRDMIVHPVSLEIAQLAGRIEGEQAAQGIAIAFEDLVIGATALHVGFDVATLNVKHFKLIPGLNIVTL